MMNATAFKLPEDMRAAARVNDHRLMRSVVDASIRGYKQDAIAELVAGTASVDNELRIILARWAVAAKPRDTMSCDLESYREAMKEKAQRDGGTEDKQLASGVLGGVFKFLETLRADLSADDWKPRLERELGADPDRNAFADVVPDDVVRDVVMRLLAELEAKAKT